ncbi:MAG: hypothetical protein QW478_01505 [Candidatus Micrarchaeaceae archaeon]
MDILINELTSYLSDAEFPTKEKSFLSCLVCKNVHDLCETAETILKKVQNKGHNISTLPDINNIILFKSIFSLFYDENMFIEDEEMGARPNWKVITTFSKDKLHTAYKIYNAFKKNLQQKDLVEALKNKNDKFFIENIDRLFNGLIKKENLNKFKNFMTYKKIDEEDKEILWSYPNVIADLILNENDHLNILNNLK